MLSLRLPRKLERKVIFMNEILKEYIIKHKPEDLWIRIRELTDQSIVHRTIISTLSDRVTSLENKHAALVSNMPRILN